MNAVIFLDIDGVLAPKERIQTYTMIEQLNKKLAYKKEYDRIEALPNNLVNQIYHHFDAESCRMILKLCESFDAKIVLTSTWRLFFSLEQLKAILNIFDLGDMVIGCTDPDVPRYRMIQNYIEAHQINNYIVIDDLNMSRQFPSHFIAAQKRFDHGQYEKAVRLLQYQI